jgi:hypothetical protein
MSSTEAQELAWPKSPTVPMPASAKGAVPGLEMVTLLGALLVPTSRAGKLTAIGDSARMPAPPAAKLANRLRSVKAAKL